jgi:signal transduction histidine kinase
LLDTSGVINEINVAALRLLGASDRLRVARSPFVIFIAESYRQTFRSHLRVMRAGAEHSQTEVRLAPRGMRDGPMVQIYSRVWTNRDTGETRYLSALLDVTERWRAQEERRAAEVARRTLVEEERSMRAANEAKDRFLAALSHELRTPLTPILLALDALAARHDIPNPIEPTLRMVRRNVEQEARLIDDLLDVTRIAHDKLRCEHEILELHPLLRDLHAAYAQEAASAGVTITLEVAATEPYVLGDAVRLKQIVSNLLRNAIRHTEAAARSPSAPRPRRRDVSGSASAITASFERFSDTHQQFLDQLRETIGIVLHTIQANSRTEGLLVQSQSLATELQSRQLELQQSNAELEEKATLLAEQNAEVERKNTEVEQARQALEEKASQLALTSKYKSEFLIKPVHADRSGRHARRAARPATDAGARVAPQSGLRSAPRETTPGSGAVLPPRLKKVRERSPGFRRDRRNRSSPTTGPSWHA